MKRSAIILWALTPWLLALTLYRPFTTSRGLAKSLPVELPGYHLYEDRELTPRQVELLGTGDAAWRTYFTDDQRYLFMVAVFHEENWKSIHPPRICLEGSNMDIREDGVSELLPGAGKIVAYSRSQEADYLSLYVYGAEHLLTGDYWEFFLYHAPSALLRSSTTGFLLRVETFVGEDGMAAAEARCADFIEKVLPNAKALLRGA